MAPHLIASGIQTLELYEFKSIDKSPSKQIKLKDIVPLKPTICTGISFDGDYDGDYIFIFNQGITELLLENILGGLDGVEGEDLLDAMSEFTNSVTGKLKTNLHKRDKCIHFNLPRSTAVLSDLVPHDAMEKPAILMTFSCMGEEFYIALTSPLK
jgi:CheY-specific phosphatase CheX